MKKFISIVLTICMLFSLITVTTAAEISEDEGLVLLAAENEFLRDIASFEVTIEGLDYPYTYSMKEIFITLLAEYESLLDKGVKESDFDTNIIAKFNELKEQYENAENYAKMVSGWKEYSYTIYAEVVSANDAKAEIAAMVAEETIKTVEEYYEIASEAKAIDDKIKALPDDYDPEIFEQILAIKAEVEAFVENGGSEAAFEYIAKLDDLYKDADEQILEIDIKNLTDRINELDKLPYSTGMDAEIEKLLQDIKDIENRGGEISPELKDVFDRLFEQRDEKAEYVTQKLNYTRDIFEDLEAFKAQATIDATTKEHIFPADAWQPTVTAVSGVTKFAVDDDAFVKKTGIDSNNYVVKNGIPYQFGPIKSVVHGVNNAPNSINAADCANSIVIDVEQFPYEEFYLAGWSRNNGSENTATITYTYTDGSTSTEKNLKVFKGGVSKPTVDGYYTEIISDVNQGIPYWRPPAADKTSDKKNGWGGYRIFIVSHRLTPDDTKTLKSIKIQPSNQDLNVLALTGKLSNSGILLNKLDETMAALKGDITNKQVTEFVSYAEKYIEALEMKGVNYDKKEEYTAEVKKYKEEYITVESVECYTDVDNRNITVKFTGAIAEDSITEQNFVLKKDGAVVENYKVEKISDKEVKITAKNTFDYECAYSLEISADVSNKANTVTLGNAEVHEYDGLVAVDAKVTYENKKIKIYVKNNLNKKLDNFVVMTGAFDENNALLKFEPVSGSLEAGAEFTKTIDFITTAPKITCDVITSLSEAKLIFGHIDLK